MRQFVPLARDLLLIASCGAVGAVGRLVVSGWTYHLLGKHFAYGTLAVNLIGCFLIGLALKLVPTHLQPAVVVGFLGAFTTFSTFGFETLHYLQDGSWALATGNVAANVVLGVLAVWGGTLLAQYYLSGS